MSGIQNSISNAISGTRVAGGGGPTPPTGEGLLDLYPGAAAAYSVRRLRDEYAGAALRVRREDTNEETDIGFDANGNLDEAALIEFCSFTNGLVSRWYDQSEAGGNDALQDVEASQPKIYDVADGIIREAGKAAVEFDGIGQRLLAASVDIDQPNSYFITYAYDNVTNPVYTDISDGSLSRQLNDLDGLDNQLRIFAGSSYRSSLAGSNNQSIRFSLFNGASSGIALDGSSLDVGNAGTTPITGLIIGGSAAVGDLDGRIQEFIIYPTDENASGNRTDIEENIADYFTDVVPLLDTYGGAAAAYSLRRLSSTYTGAAVAVRNSGGSVANIGFDIFGRLDVAALTAHCGAGNGTVQTWFDQSGSGNHATQSDPTRQPKIYDASTAYLGELQYTGDFHNITISAVTSRSIFAVAESTGLAGTFGVFGSLSAGNAFGIRETDKFYDNSNGISAISSAGLASLNQYYAFTSIINSAATNKTVYVDGSQVATASGTATSSTLLEIARSANVNFKELILYPSDQDGAGNREPIEDNIDKFYGITPEGLLDRYPGAAAAYSLRRLTRSYRGPLITARRADGQLKDIYATREGGLDITSLAAWSSGQNATVQVWFDQSGDGNHAEQLTPSAQPKVYDSATGVVTDGGLPAVDCDYTFGASLSATSPSGFDNMDDFTLVMAANFTLLENYSYNFTLVDTAGLDILLRNEDPTTFRAGAFSPGSGAITVGSSVGRHLIFAGYGSNSQLVIDGSSTSGTIDISAYSTSDSLYINRVGAGLNARAKYHEIICYPSDESSKRVGIEDDLAEYYNLKEERLLDRGETTGAAAAYSLRLLSNAHLASDEPYAIRVRRSTDNEEGDIGFDGFGNLNVSLLEDFCDGGDGFVSLWFDQSGNGNNASQIDELLQPQIVASGSVITENGKPAIQTDGSDDRLVLASTISFTDLTWFTVTKKNDTDIRGSIIFFGGGTNAFGGDDVDNRGNPFLQAVGTQVIRNTLGNTSASGGEINQHLSYYNRNGTNASGGLNGEVNPEATVGTTAFGLTELFQYSANYNYEGLVQELILYPSDKSNHRELIESNIGIYYGLPIGLLDKYSGAAAAYSLRQLSTSYDGPLVQVRRSGDGKLLDIYPDAFGDLDTATLTAFSTGLNATVQKWYDQSSNGNDAEQTTTAIQAKIYDGTSDAVITNNGKPALQPTGVPGYPTGISGLTNTTIFAVGNNALAPDSLPTTVPRIVSSYGGGGPVAANQLIFRYRSDTNVYELVTSGGTASVSGAGQPDNFIATFKKDGSTGYIGFNGSSYGSGTIGGITNELYLFEDAGTGNAELITAHHEIVIYDSAQNDTNREGIETDINDYYGIYEPFTTGLLDDYPGAAAAYSLRRLSSTYTGPAIAVRKDGDPAGTTQDIGFDIEGNLDVNALTAYCGASDGFAEVWYDQSGNGNDATQTATGDQPRVCIGGTVVADEDGRAAVQFLSTFEFHLITQTYAVELSQNPASVFVVASAASGEWNYMLAEGDALPPSYSSSFILGGPTGTDILWVNANTFGSTTSGRNSLGFDYSGGTEYSVYLNGPTAVDSGTASLVGTETSIGTYIGSRADGDSPFFNGLIQEIITYKSNQGSAGNRPGIEENINDYYEIYDTGLLAEYPGAAAAYSLRLLTTAHLRSATPYAVQVRRDSDDALMDIGFDAEGNLDVDALTIFCYGTDGYVSVWYDQSSSGNDATQADPLKQPKIYDSSTGVVTENGKPALQFISDYLDLSSGTQYNAGLFYAGLLSGSIYGFSAQSDNDNGWRSHAQPSAMRGRFNAINVDNFADSSVNGRLLHVLTFNGTTGGSYINGDNGVSASVSVADTTSISPTIGTVSYGGTTYNGHMQEIIVYNSDQSTKRTNIEGNINDYYEIYP